MEIQSGNGEEVVSAVSATSGSFSGSPFGSKTQASDDAVREDLQAAKRIERFDIPLDSLRRMFEKPTVENTVSTTTLLLEFAQRNDPMSTGEIGLRSLASARGKSQAAGIEAGRYGKRLVMRQKQPG
ncbi:hypothetical protein LDENG_00090230 [Lucifuga dentata]|nr:hypothetical protein LDENG_00090230 [Lucifuga dentata]